MFNFVYGTSGMIESFKMIMAMGKSIFILGAVATFVFLFYWAFNQMTGKAILLTICIMFTGIIVSAIGMGNLICISNRNIKTAIKNDYPDAVMTDMTVENKTSYGTFQANKEEYCYKIENNQLRIWEKD